MARRDGRATSYYAKETRLNRVNSLLCVVISLLCVFPFIADAGLYTASDQIIVLSPDNVDSVLFSSSAALVVEFYATWCGHCVAFSPVWKSLARDIKGLLVTLLLFMHFEDDVSCSSDAKQMDFRYFAMVTMVSVKIL